MGTALGSADMAVAWLGWRDLLAGTAGILGYLWVVTTLTGVAASAPLANPQALSAVSMSWLLGLVLFLDAWRRAVLDRTLARRTNFDGELILRLCGIRPSVLAVRGTLQSLAGLAPLAWVPAVPLALFGAGMSWSALGGLPWIGFGDAIGTRWAASGTGLRAAMVIGTAVAWALAIPGLSPLGALPMTTGAWLVPMEVFSRQGGPLQLMAMTALSITCSGLCRYLTVSGTGQEVTGEAHKVIATRQPVARARTPIGKERAGLAARDRSSLLAWARKDPVVLLVTAIPTAYLCALIASQPNRVEQIFAPSSVALAMTLVLPTLALSEALWGGESRSLMGYIRLTNSRGLAPLLQGRVRLLCTILVVWHVLTTALLSAVGHASTVGAIRYAVVGASGIVAAGAATALAALVTTAFNLGMVWIGRPVRYTIVAAGLLAPFAVATTTAGWFGALAMGVAIAGGALRLAVFASERVQFHELSAL